MLLWVLFAVLAAAAALAVARPFLSARVESGNGMASAIYRAQLAELRQEAEAGTLSASEAEEARREVARRLLAADEAEKKRPARGLKGEVGLGLGLSLIVPIGALALYVMIGRPDLPGEPLASRDMEAALQTAPLDQVAESLFQRLAMDPGHAEMWQLLASLYMRMERYDEAASAYGRAIDLRGTAADAALFAAYGEALSLAAGGRVTEAAGTAFEVALRLEPGNQAARYYLAVRKAQAGDAAGAVADLKALLDDMPADAPERGIIEARLNELDQPSIREMPEVRAMVEGLEARLEAEPENLDGWLLLMTSYVRLEEVDRARAALASAREVFKNDPAALEQIAAKAKELGLEL